MGFQNTEAASDQFKRLLFLSNPGNWRAFQNANLGASVLCLDDCCRPVQVGNFGEKPGEWYMKAFGRRVHVLGHLHMVHRHPFSGHIVFLQQVSTS